MILKDELKQIYDEFIEAEKVSINDETYLATGYWLDDEFYFRLGSLIENMED